MFRRDDARSRPAASPLAVVVMLAAAAASAADPPRGAGLVTAPRKTREELVREWDLNSDGKIDKGEMEVASSRMRLERAELRLNSGIDPLTGLPRGTAPIVQEPDDADIEAEAEVPEDEPPDADADKRLPGTRVPRPTLPGAGRGGPAKPAEAEPAPAGGKAGLAGTRAAADQKRQPFTGGVRGGGLPARAGYGAGVPAAPLNAGLPIPPKPRPGATLPARGGLVPAPRQPAPAPRPSGPRDLYDPY
jgi:hypothetical protein